MAARSLGIIADDLSGAAECASHALLRVSRSIVVLAVPITGSAPDDPIDPVDASTVVTVDTDSRRLPAEEAVRAVRAAASLVAEAPVVVKKIDSLLRGHVGAELAALAQELQRTPVVAVANPALDRVVRDGVLHVGGTPLHRTELWAVEPTAAPARVAEALHPLPTVLVPHTVVALGVDAVADALASAADAGLVAVCDAVTDGDLDIVHAAATRSRSAALLVGSGALAAVAVRALPADHANPTPDAGRGTQPAAHRTVSPPDEGHGADAVGSARSLLFVLGTRASGVTAQIAQLRSVAAETVLVQPDELLTDPTAVAARLEALPTDGIVVVALDPSAGADPTRSRALTEALSDAVAPVLDRYDAAFLSGGETARAVLDRLGVGTLEVVGEVDTGTVVSRRPGGRLVVTRPGSFGGPDSLVRVTTQLLVETPAALRHAPPHHSSPNPHPTVSATTGARTGATGATTEENP